MSSNRNIRNPQQLRALIQNMGRSIDEARSRRLGPDTPTQPAPAARSDIRGDNRNDIRGDHSAPANIARESDGQRPGAQGSPAANGRSANGSNTGSAGSTPTAAPPVRGANEMFDGAAPRLKARPKRAS